MNDQFLPSHGGTISLFKANSIYDLVSCPPLPSDGVKSLYRDGGTRLNLATNFARQTASVVQPSSYSLSPLDLSNIAAVGGAPIITVTAPVSFPVAATSLQPWVTINRITPNGGTTTVALQVSANASATGRATSIRVADRLFLITQHGQ